MRSKFVILIAIISSMVVAGGAWSQGRTVKAINKTPYVLIFEVGEKSVTLQPAETGEFDNIVGFWEARIRVVTGSELKELMSFRFVDGGDMSIGMRELEFVTSILYGSMKLSPLKIETE